MIGQFENMFGCKPREYSSPLEKGDHPEVDTSEELDAEGIKKYQTMIGSLQWASFAWPIRYTNSDDDHVTVQGGAKTRTFGSVETDVRIP